MFYHILSLAMLLDNVRITTKQSPLTLLHDNVPSEYIMNICSKCLLFLVKHLVIQHVHIGRIASNKFSGYWYMPYVHIRLAEPEPADLQWSGQKIRLDFNLLMCYDITSLSILYNLVCMGIHSYNSIII